jgi:hypothetical protein
VELDALGIPPITDEKTCKLHYTSLNNKLGTVYKNWKASGNGEHQVAGSSLEEAEYGMLNLELLPTQGGDRIDFLGKSNICVMYLWFSLIKAGAFLYSQTEFPEEFQADDGIAPKISKMGGGSSIGSSGGSTSSKSTRTGNKKIAATTVETEMEKFSRNVEKINNSMLLDSELDRLQFDRHEIKDDIKELKKEVNVLFDKKHKTELDYLSEQDKQLRLVKKRYWERMCERYDAEESSYLKKEKEMKDIQQKIDLMKQRLFEIKEKTPKRSGNSSKETRRNRAVPNSIVVAADDDPAVAINFDTPAAASTPTCTTSQVNEWLKEQQKNEKKRKQVDTPEESIDLLAQKTPPENEYDDDDDDDDDDELFQKVL